MWKEIETSGEDWSSESSLENQENDSVLLVSVCCASNEDYVPPFFLTAQTKSMVVLVEFPSFLIMSKAKDAPLPPAINITLSASWEKFGIAP